MHMNLKNVSVIVTNDMLYTSGIQPGVREDILGGMWNLK
jgi:hypothetical protein